MKWLTLYVNLMILWVKYQIKDNDVFERAYQYIEMYY